jgi:hypothetical protein
MYLIVETEGPDSEIRAVEIGEDEIVLTISKAK